MNERLKRLKEISRELHDIANSYSGDETGLEASLLHLSIGNISSVISSLEDGIPFDEYEVVKTYIDWSSEIRFLRSL